MDLDKTFVFVAGGDVYLADKYLNGIERIDDSGTVEIASISNDHQHVLFKREGENIQIYNIAAGRIDGEVPNSQTALWFDYHANNETIYYLRDERFLDTHGPEVLVRKPIDLISHGGLITAYVRVGGVVVLSDGRFLFSVGAGTSILVLSDGNQSEALRKQYYNNPEYLRLHRNEIAVWGTLRDGREIKRYRVSDLSELSGSSSYALSVPADEEAGYYVTQDNELRAFNGRMVPSPGGRITAIDY